MDKLDFLRENPLFAVLGDEELAALGRLFVQRAIPKDAVIFQEGDHADALYVLREGRVKVMLSDPDGREVIISVLKRGECFGEMALLDSDGRSAQVMSMTPCELLILSKSDFRGWLARNPAMAMAIIQELSQRLRRANQTINNLATQDVQGRVARILIDAAEQQSDGQLLIAEPPTQKDIASMVGASRERVNRALKDLEATGFLRHAGRQILLADSL